MSLSSYSKIQQLHHRDVIKMRGELLTIQEKVDGSQISFGVRDGQMFIKSKNHMINTEKPEGMFKLAVENLAGLALPNGYVFRGEFLNRPKHNVLAYDRVPLRNIIIYDIEKGDGSNIYMPYDEVADIAFMYGFETVPTVGYGVFDDITRETELLDKLLDNVSILGGQKIEGLVIKCYDQLSSSDKTLMVKYVRPGFREMNGGKTKIGKADILKEIVEKYNTEARMDKALIHLREQEKITGEMKDIGLLMREFNQDFEAECVDDIKDMLYKRFRKDILRGVSRGLPDWYRNKLLYETTAAG